MTKSKSANTMLSFAAIIVGLIGTMLTMRSFLASLPLWGAYYLAITLATLVTFIAIRSQSHVGE